MEALLLEKLVILVVGWLLGLLGPAVVDAIRRKRENQLGRQALLSELRELGSTLALAAYGIRMDQGSVDRRFLEWLKLDLERFASSDEMQNHVPKLRSFLALADSDLVQLNARIAMPSQKATMLQHLSAPLLDSRVSALWSFETSFQRQQLEVKHHLSLLDDLVERSRKYFDLTFSQLDSDNRRLVRENLLQATDEYARRAELVVGKIRRLSGDAQ
jgi:hypothetical protein